jgi:hypothetical protein
MKLQKSHDLARSFGRLKTLIDLEKYVADNTIFGESIKLAFVEKKPTDEIIRTIKEQLQDNRELVCRCIPPYLVDNIEKYW